MKIKVNQHILNIWHIVEIQYVAVVLVKLQILHNGEAFWIFLCTARQHYSNGVPRRPQLGI